MDARKVLAGVCCLAILYLLFRTGGGDTDVSAVAEDLVLVAPTYFGTVNEPRFALTAAACRDAARLGITMVVIDASARSVRTQLEATGVRVLEQRTPGKKGVALREGIAEAQRILAGRHGMIAFFEPEKKGIVPLVATAAAHLRRANLDVVMPRRDAALFQRTYPWEQYLQESFTNVYLDSIAAQAGFPVPLDWTFGPMVFDARLAQHWLRFRGDLWDAQVVPVIRAVRWHGARVGGLDVAYAHPAAMKAEEEGVGVWIAKRLKQLQLWADTLPVEFQATSEPMDSGHAAAAVSGSTPTTRRPTTGDHRSASSVLRKLTRPSS